MNKGLVTNILNIDEMEKEIGMSISNAYIMNSFKVMIPVKIKIGHEYIIVTTVSIYKTDSRKYTDYYSHRQRSKKYFGV